MSSGTYSIIDNKLRFYANERLTKEEYEEAKKAGFRWAPRQELFVAPQWTPYSEDWLLSQVDMIENEEMTPEERAEERAERFDGYSSKRLKESGQQADYADHLSQAFEFGQPILVGHHSEKKARKTKERMDGAMRKAINLFETSAYWTERAHASLAHAQRREMPRVRWRRRKKLQAEARKFQREIDTCDKVLEFYNKPELTEKKALAGFLHSYRLFGFYLDCNTEYNEEKKDWVLKEPLAETIERFNRGFGSTKKHYTRWLEHTTRRIEYETVMLDGYDETPVKRKKPDLAPLLNFPSEGCLEMTAKEWKEHNKYDSYQVRNYLTSGGLAEWRTKGDYRRRVHVQMMRSKYTPVFITDSKVKYPEKEVKNA